MVFSGMECYIMNKLLKPNPIDTLKRNSDLGVENCKGQFRFVGVLRKVSEAIHLSLDEEFGREMNLVGWNNLDLKNRQ